MANVYIYINIPYMDPMGCGLVQRNLVILVHLHIFLKVSSTVCGYVVPCKACAGKAGLVNNFEFSRLYVTNEWWFLSTKFRGLPTYFREVLVGYIFYTYKKTHIIIQPGIHASICFKMCTHCQSPGILAHLLRMVMEAKYLAEEVIYTPQSSFDKVIGSLENTFKVT